MKHPMAVAALAVALVVAPLLVATTSATASDRDPDGRGSITVEVTDDGQAGGGGGGAPGPAPAGLGTRPAGGGGAVTQATIPDPGAADDALGNQPVSASGIIAMGGLTATPSPGLDPGNGSILLDFVVRNVSESTFDATATFWVDNMFGARLDQIADVAVRGLEPGETRRVQARVDALGQHLVLHAHASLTPAAEVDGADAATFTRSTMVVVPPLLTLSVLALLAGLATAGWWFVRWALAVRVAGVAT